MSFSRKKLESELSSKIPSDILTQLLDEYANIKQQFFLGRFQPSELNGARYCECILRLIEHLNTGTYTAFGKQLNSEQIIRSIENNTTLPDTFRFFIPRLARVILDVRNKRNVAHVGREVNPNLSDSLLIVQATDWILMELVRYFHTSSISEAQKIVDNINTIKLPVVAEVDGFIRVQNTKLDARTKTLVILYYKKPKKVADSNIIKWLRYSNASRFRKEILSQLDTEALIHYEANYCTLLPKGVVLVEQTVPFNLLS
ncbi:MAG: hypothetical protein GFH27_549305n131 [Chloroflexi bacterium AL-W]|nr:hypothetical protein [Chloroflexi bacterium AL-N1]NOK69377.1 hypothetical protein [Chloroflexi bacterium AL-N10]NOK76438.1 hypothetical protein [Chloroflexi bacterium AL-N5]NOK83555.1 hypothetical protein [Chloroflexi bacterium AL-W]NOK91215.1 hypothetical protein [Chloroflexi bacterium AL-N15]